MSTPRAIAYANDSVVFIAWEYPAKIANCLGFQIVRHDKAAGTAVPLPAWVGFQGGSNAAWIPKTTAVWPVQKYNWNDFTAELGKTYVYEIIPMTGTEDALTAATDSALTTNDVTLTTDASQGAMSVSAAFTHGILSTQFLAHQLPPGPNGGPSSTALMTKISDPSDPLRKELAGNTTAMLVQLLKKAMAEDGSCYAALYEFTDPELIDAVIAAQGKVHLILGNSGPDNTENCPTRRKLLDAGIDVTDRFLAAGHIPHNKFILYVDKNGVPQSVRTGSTNWTAQAMCGQSNNVLGIDDPAIASLYLDFWKRLKADGAAQGPELRATNAQGTLPDPADPPNIQIWFSPNTVQKTKPQFHPATPPDLKMAFELMDGAQQAILFLEFEPGSPSVIDEALKMQESKPGLFVRGAVSTPAAMPKTDNADTNGPTGNDVTLFHRQSEDPIVVPATAVNDTFSYWEAELLKSAPTAHAIIHDKIVVIDPFSENCVVMTGSHNQGFRASYNNDENLVIVRGNQKLAAAYAVHILDVYDHYRFRYLLSQNQQNAFSGLSTTDVWQDPYFSDGKSGEFGIWFGDPIEPQK